MRVLICSDEADLLLPLLASLDLTIDLCDSGAMPGALTPEVGAALIAEEAWARLGEQLRAELQQAAIPLIVLGAATQEQSCATFSTPGLIVLERPFTSRSLCSCLTASIKRPTDALGDGDIDLALLQSRKMAAIASLTGGIAHDFNNMLTGVIGALDIMKRRVAKGQLDGIERFIKAASVSADRASALTQRLLTFSHRQPMDARPVEVDPLLVSLELLIRRTVSEGIALRSDYQHGSARVVVDTRQLESAILNLAINARDAMPDGGQISLQTSLVTLGQNSITALPAMLPGRYLLMAFSDTGVGMDRDALEKAFDPFYTTKSLGQSSGLGLSMVYGFARQSGGQVTIHSTPGTGTTVRLYLPVDEQLSTEQPLTDEAQPQAVAAHRVLLVEGDSAVRLLVSEVLAAMGCDAVNAADPLAAIDLLASTAPFDLLIADNDLPGMTGVQLFDIVYQHRPDLPVLLIAGKGDSPPTMAHPLKTIGKPFSMRELSESLADMLPPRG